MKTWPILLNIKEGTICARLADLRGESKYAQQRNLEPCIKYGPAKLNRTGKEAVTYIALKFRPNPEKHSANPPPPSITLASMIRHKSKLCSGNLMLNTGTLSIERIAYYTEGKDPEAAWNRAKEDLTNAIFRVAYSPIIRPLIAELIRELRRLRRARGGTDVRHWV